MPVMNGFNTLYHFKYVSDKKRKGSSFETANVFEACYQIK